MATKVEGQVAYKWIGKSIQRVEDPRFLVGGGNYIDDLTLPGMAHMALLHSPHAHARILNVDVSEALKVPGVLAVLTGRDVAERTNPLPKFGMGEADQYCLAIDKVRHFGEGVAAVVATSRAIAEDAVERIRVEYEVLPAVVDPESAIDEKSVLVHESLGSNVFLHRRFTFGDVDKDFREADRIIRDRLRWPRVSAQPLETAGAVAKWDRFAQKLTIWSSSSFLNYMGWMIGDTLKIPANQINFIPCDIGGNFGSKLFQHKVWVLAALGAMVTGRPVKYIEDRYANFVNSDNHASDRIYEVELAVTQEGIFKSLRMKVVDDYGAYFHYGSGSHGNALAQIVGPYKIQSVDVDLYCVCTNKCQQGAYRGYGSEVNNFVLERMVDLAARELKLDRIEIRRRNFIRPHEFPYKIPTGNIYDSGNYEAVLNKALELIDLNYWKAEQERARQEGRYIGIGLVTCQERSVLSTSEFWFWYDNPTMPVMSSPDSASIRINPLGQVTITLYSPFWGNSPETVATQIVAEELGIDPKNIKVCYADTDQGLPSFGPGGSRYTVMVAGALVGAAKKLKEKIFKIASQELECPADDLEMRDNKVIVKGIPERAIDLASIAVKAHLLKTSLPEGLESGLEASYTYDHPYTTPPAPDRKDLGVFYPIMGHACHIPIVEVDPETGQVKFLKYVAVHDCGTVVNPAALESQIIGGTAQGIEIALLAKKIYGPDGQLLTTTYMDYPLPSATDMPDFIQVEHVVTPSPFTAYGIKGAGEGGRMMAPGAIASAIEDALSPFGVRVREIPLTPEVILKLIEEARMEAR